MATIKLTIEYDGTAYAGWQRQPNHPTIQAVLEDALTKITQQHITVVAAGRTDSGVHALGQVVSFESDKILDSAQWRPALHRYLPKDISVISSEEAPEDFHARYSAKGKIYEYQVSTQAFRPALNRYRVWHLPHTLDTEAIQQAIPDLCGTHDFTSFRGQRSQTLNPVCTISHLSLRSEIRSFTFRIAGDRFLKHMVRNIVGTVIEVGQHKRPSNSLQEVLLAKDRRAAGRTAPPHGLYLTQVLY